MLRRACAFLQLVQKCTHSCRCTLNRSCFYSPIKNNKLMATTPHLQLNGLWLLWRTGSACRRPLLISLPSKGKLNNVGQMLQPSHPTQAGTQMHTTLPPPSLQIKKQKRLYVLEDNSMVATHRQCSVSVVTKCRNFMPDSAVVVRKYILILWSPLLCW